MVQNYFIISQIKRININIIWILHEDDGSQKNVRLSKDNHAFPKKFKEPN